jgi:hypothetical protein
MDAVELDKIGRIIEQQLRPPVAEVRRINLDGVRLFVGPPLTSDTHEDHGSSHQGGHAQHPAGTRFVTTYTSASTISATGGAFQIAVPAPEVGSYASDEIVGIVKLDGTRELFRVFRLM